MTNALAVLALLLAVLAATPAVAQDEEKEDIPVSLGPLNFTLGWQDNAFAVGVEADTAMRLGPASSSVAFYLGSIADGSWSTDTDQTPTFSLTLRPGLAYQHAGMRNGRPWTTGPLLHFFGDVRYRAAPANDEGAPADNTPRFLSQLIAGGGAELRLEPVALWWTRALSLSAIPEIPRLSVGYNAVVENSIPDAELPDALTVDVWQAKATAEFPLPLLCSETDVEREGRTGDIFDDSTPVRACPFIASLEGISTFNSDVATEWYGDVAVAWFINKKLAPVVRYRTGAEHGLEYDEQLLLGMLLKF